MPAEPSVWPASKNSSVGDGTPARAFWNAAHSTSRLYLKPWNNGRDFIHLVVRVERIFPDAQLVALARHDVHRIVQHALDEKIAQLRHQHVGLGEIAHRHRQRADMVVVAVGDRDRIQVMGWPALPNSGSASRPSRFGCMPASSKMRWSSISTSHALAPMSESGFKFVTFTG